MFISLLNKDFERIRGVRDEFFGFKPWRERCFMQCLGSRPALQIDKYFAISRGHYMIGFGLCYTRYRRECLLMHFCMLTHFLLLSRGMTFVASAHTLLGEFHIKLNGFHANILRVGRRIGGRTHSEHIVSVFITL